jgi:hypothetical protein
MREGRPPDISAGRAYRIAPDPRRGGEDHDRANEAEGSTDDTKVRHADQLLKRGRKRLRFAHDVSRRSSFRRGGGSERKTPSPACISSRSTRTRSTGASLSSALALLGLYRRQEADHYSCEYRCADFSQKQHDLGRVEFPDRDAAAAFVSLTRLLAMNPATQVAHSATVAATIIHTLARILIRQGRAGRP